MGVRDTCRSQVQIASNRQCPVSNLGRRASDAHQIFKGSRRQSVVALLRRQEIRWVSASACQERIPRCLATEESDQPNHAAR